MFQLTAGYLEKNYKFTDHNPRFIMDVFSTRNCEIVGIVSVDHTMWNPFETTDNQQWYVFKVRRQGIREYPYVVVLFGYDDGYCFKNLKSIDQFYQWIEIFETRDFTNEDVQKYIDEIF